ncbi:DMT family transporter [Bartonella sp. HY406]|uniref:DMT family transporter n=1 Tax=Bartonella sp. HY406 TaxID=2979331 RepID=UPI0021C84F8D|nr:EamA family transporter [Bartonella sp. HY406]UXN02420.1 EamA family transporter [Bartonella sp. HY406]
MSKDYYYGLGAVFFAALLWGTTGTAAAMAPQVGPIAIGAAAMGLGGLIQAFMARKKISAQLSALKRHWVLLLAGGISVLVYPLAFYASMRLAGVTIGTVISIGSAPLCSVIIERFFERHPISMRWLIGICVGLVGIILLCLATHHGASTKKGDENPLLGIFLGLVAGLTYAGYSWTSRQLMQKGIASSAAMGATFGLGGLMLMPILLATGAPFLLSWQNFSVGLYMALIPMFLGYLCFGYGLARIKASLAITITLMEPVVAAFLAVLILGERLPLIGWLGVLLILASLVFVTLPSNLFNKKTKTAS